MATFSKKHCQAIAGMLANVKNRVISSMPIEYMGDGDRAVQWAIGDLACNLAYMFERDNSRFDREHFLAAVRGERSVNSRPPKSHEHVCGAECKEEQARSRRYNSQPSCS